MLPMCRLVCELGKNDPKHELALRHGQVGQGVPPASVKAALALAAATARESGKHQADVLGLPLTPEQQRLQVLLACLEDCQYWPFLQEYATAGQRLQGLFTSALHLLFGPATSLNLQHLAYPQLVQHLEGDLDQADVLKQLLIVYDGPPNSLYLPVHTVAEAAAQQEALDDWWTLSTMSTPDDEPTPASKRARLHH